MESHRDSESILDVDEKATSIGTGCAGLTLAVMAIMLSTWLLGTNVEQLLLGWLYFPFRTVPQMTVDWASAIIGCACLLLFVVGLHWTASWFVGRRNRSDVDGKHWSWRTSVLATSAIVILFVSGTALIATCHQILWLVSGRSGQAAIAERFESSGILAQARDSGRQSESRSNLQQLALGFISYQYATGAFPPGGTINEAGEMLHGWAIPIGPYVSYAAPDDLDYNQSWKSAENAKVFKCQLSYFLNPSLEGPVFDKEGFGLCHYAGNVHVLPIRTVQVDDESITNRPPSTKGVAIEHINDGTANTILLGTIAQNLKPWGYPANVRDPALGINRRPDGFGGPHHWHGGHFAMCDGSARFLSEDIDPEIMKALGTINGGETIPEDYSR